MFFYFFFPLFCAEWCMFTLQNCAIKLVFVRLLPCLPSGRGIHVCSFLCASFQIIRYKTFLLETTTKHECLYQIFVLIFCQSFFLVTAWRRTFVVKIAHALSARAFVYEAIHRQTCSDSRVSLGIRFDQICDHRCKLSNRKP